MSARTETFPRKYTIAEYLQMEEKSSVKHHFINGKIIVIPGATYDRTEKFFDYKRIPSFKA